MTSPDDDGVASSVASGADATRAPRPPGRVAAALRAWLRLPDVVADPEQTEDGRVWTRAQDVLPGVVVREGTALTAAWGDQVWTAMPIWVDDDPDGLWLDGMDQPTGAPQVGNFHREEAIVNRLDGADRDTIAAVVGALLADFDDTVRVSAGAQENQRRWAAGLIDDLARVSPAALRALDELPTGRVLRAFARRPFGFEDGMAG